MSEPEIVFVDALECPVEQYDWPFAREHADKIEAHWQKEFATRGGLWNGRILMCRDANVVQRDERKLFSAKFFETNFSALVACRDWNFPDPTIRNCFAMAALRAADGPFLLVKMGGHTANPGRVYFPAGTPDSDDIVGHRLDLDASVMRELTEETGLSADDVEEIPGYTLVFSGGRIACLKEMRTHMRAADAIARVAEFLRGETDPEIDALVAVAAKADLDPDHMPDFIQAFLRARFDADQPG